MGHVELRLALTCEAFLFKAPPWIEMPRAMRS